jgi:glyoxylase-like metal-dependent hydrolase (beta-lactamase superfamily II)
MSAENNICFNCGTQFPATDTEPTSCPICEDDREAISQNQQRWTTLGEMYGRYKNQFSVLEPRVTGIVTHPEFAIGQEAYIVQTEEGNVLWDCLSYIDEDTFKEVSKLGGITAISISHPHLYGSMIEWSRAFGNAPIYLHVSNRSWVMRTDGIIHFWEGDSLEVLSGLTLIRCGGHFPGSCVLHWDKGADGKGVIFTSDTIQPVEDRRWISFMYSYPNLIPLSAKKVRQILAAVEPFEFERIYGGRFYGVRGEFIIRENAKQIVQRSAERYIKHLEEK